MFCWIWSQSRWALRNFRKGVASRNDLALPPPSTAPNERSMIQVKELRAWAKASQRKISEGRNSAHSLARTLVAMENSSQPTARAQPFTAPADEPPKLWKTEIRPQVIERQFGK